MYFPVVGADSAFEIIGDRVVPLGRGIASQQLARLGVQQFVDTLAKREASDGVEEEIAAAGRIFRGWSVYLVKAGTIPGVEPGD